MACQTSERAIQVYSVSNHLSSFTLIADSCHRGAGKLPIMHGESEDDLEGVDFEALERAESSS